MVQEGLALSLGPRSKSFILKLGFRIAAHRNDFADRPITNNPTTKNHYIPSFYTKQWTGADGKLCQFRKLEDGRTVRKRHVPDGVGYEKNLYTVPDVPPKVSRHIEEVFLFQTDQLGCDALQVLLTGKTSLLSQRQRVGWTRFIMTLLQRNPEKVRWIARVWGHLYVEAFHDAISELEKRGDHEQLIAQLKEGIDPVKQKISGVNVLQQLMDLPNLGNFIMNMRWSVLTFPQHNTLLTSDRPVVMTNGLNRPEGHLAFSISPNQLFVAVKDPKNLSKIMTHDAEGLVTDFNRAVCAQAKTFVYGLDDGQLDFVAQHIGSDPQFIAGQDMREKYPLEENAPRIPLTVE